jgi:hypothetical protein
VELHTVEDQNLMDAAVESFVSREKDQHNSFRKSKRGQICCQRCCDFMACGSIITYHWQLNTFITTCDFSTFVCCCVVPTSGRFAKNTFGFMRGTCMILLRDAVTALTVAPEDWIKTLAAMWLEYNLLQESTATTSTCLIESIICGQFG